MDDFTHVEGTSPTMLEPRERQLLDGVDVVVARAESLTRKERGQALASRHTWEVRAREFCSILDALGPSERRLTPVRAT